VGVELKTERFEMAELTRYSGSKNVLVQFRIAGTPELLPVIHERTVDPTAPRRQPATPKELLKIHGANGCGLRKTLEESGLIWVDAYFEHRPTSNGRIVTLLTFYWGREPNHPRELELMEQAFPVMENLHTARWGDITVTEFTPADGSHTFNSIVFDHLILGEGSNIDESRLRSQEYEDFGLTKTWSVGNVKTKAHIAA
jgi:hypothetical protein